MTYEIEGQIGEVPLIFVLLLFLFHLFRFTIENKLQLNYFEMQNISKLTPTSSITLRLLFIGGSCRDKHNNHSDNA